jgi:hypothetical protein
MALAGVKNWAEWDDRPDPPDEHYQVTDALREAIQGLAVQEQEKEAGFLPKISAREALQAPKEFFHWWKKAPWVSFPWMQNYKDYTKMMATEAGENLMIPRAAFQAKGYAGPIGMALVGGDIAGRATGLNDSPEGWGSHMPWSRWQGLDERERARQVLQDITREERSRWLEERAPSVQKFLNGLREKSANFKTVADVLRRARQLRGSGFMDSADRMTVEHLGKVYSAAKRMPDGPLSGLKLETPVPRDEATRMLQAIKDSLSK